MRTALALQINATSMAPITAVQFGANRLYEEAFVKLKGGHSPVILADGHGTFVVQYTGWQIFLPTAAP